MIWFIPGLVALILGAELLVRGASKLALSYGISPLVVGLTVVAFGTSAPELAISVQSAWSGQVDLALGNVVGSNVFNVLFILRTPRSASAPSLVLAETGPTRGGRERVGCPQQPCNSSEDALRHHERSPLGAPSPATGPGRWRMTTGVTAPVRRYLLLLGLLTLAPVGVAIASDRDPDFRVECVDGQPPTDSVSCDIDSRADEMCTFAEQGGGNVRVPAGGMVQHTTPAGTVGIFKCVSSIVPPASSRPSRPPADAKALTPDQEEERRLCASWKRVLAKQGKTAHCYDFRTPAGRARFRHENGPDGYGSYPAEAARRKAEADKRGPQ